jgi:hypothetical protein
MTEEQRRRIEQLQQRRATPRADRGTDGTVTVGRQMPTRRAPKHHVAERSRMLALGGSVFGATLLVSSMWSQATVQAGSAASAPVSDPVTVPAAPAPQNGVIHLRIVRVPSSGGAATLRQTNPVTEVTTPPPVDPQPTVVAPAPKPVTRSRGS